jgi:hypothetical protein
LLFLRFVSLLPPGIEKPNVFAHYISEKKLIKMKKMEGEGNNQY